MVNTVFTSLWVIGGWVTVVAITTAASVTIGANLSTTALVAVLGMVPAIVVAFIAASAPPPTVAEILYAVESKEGGS